jgi:peptidoglycan hydrolase CwlO-like protein
MDTTMDNEQIYTDFITELDRNTFLRIGQSLVSNSGLEKDEYDVIIKTDEEVRNEYLTKLNNKLDSLLYKQEQLLLKINDLTIENNATLKNMKNLKVKINNKDSIISFITLYFNKEELENQHNEETEKYCNVFVIITQLHEQVLEIEEQIKNTKKLLLL